ncbi:S8 family serine peptidase [Cognaticolwellia mytili]|uniref:S8 family serine peptidase n=1 Tax=Cognaticolwellia mytili TaxID=1888913 RepID=UPI00117F443F|nr:S8 family serine peptidase [Cognaticolwellia mytili]
MKVALIILTSYLLINFSAHAMANTSKNLAEFENKFDTSIQEIKDGIATYLVYFGEDWNDETTFATRKSSPLKSINQQKYISSRRANTIKAIASEKYQLIHSYKAVPAMVIRASEKVIRQLAKSPLVRKIGLDNSGGSGHLNDAIPQANMDLVKALPLSGVDVEVAIIDSGLDQNHPDFANRVASQVCFSSDCNISIYDQNGHGTNVAGIVAGAGSIAPEGGAPGVTLHILKVLDADNKFDTASQIVSALDHIITELPNVSIVNMSVGTGQLFASSCDDDYSWTRSLAAAVNQLNARGVALFASSGNEGNKAEITAPACLNNVIAVGATWDNRISNYSGFCTESSPIAGEITCFSNSNDNVDLVAPGAIITSTGRNHGISNYAGTSMAAPLVASCAALLRQYKPALTPLELRNTLVKNGGAIVTDVRGRSFPSLDCWQAYSSLLADHPPILTRLSPHSPLSSTETVLNFTLNAQDNEDGNIAEQVTWWINNVNTEITGGNFNYTFALGNYTVTAKVIDSANNEAILNWEVAVAAEENALPKITINLPDNNSEHNNGQSINFSAIATSQHNDDISDNIQWLYNNKIIAEGASFNQVFSAGSHAIIAKIQDNNQNEEQTTINFTVKQPPIVTEPTSGSSGGSINMALLLLLIARFVLHQNLNITLQSIKRLSKYR